MCWNGLLMDRFGLLILKFRSSLALRVLNLLSLLLLILRELRGSGLLLKMLRRCRGWDRSCGGRCCRSYASFPSGRRAAAEMYSRGVWNDS